MAIDLNKSGDYIESGDQYHSKIEEIVYESEDKKQQKIKEAERLLNEGMALRKLNKYQEAIECYGKVIKINPNYDKAWNNKGMALCN